MSTSYSCRVELRALAEKLHDEAFALEQAAATLETLEASEEHATERARLVRWAKDWFEKQGS